MFFTFFFCFQSNIGLHLANLKSLYRIKYRSFRMILFQNDKITFFWSQKRKSEKSISKGYGNKCNEANRKKIKGKSQRQRKAERLKGRHKQRSLDAHIYIFDCWNCLIWILHCLCSWRKKSSSDYVDEKKKTPPESHKFSAQLQMRRHDIFIISNIVYHSFSWNSN